MRGARWMVLVGFASVNLGIGLCYGTFGTLILHLERAFAVDRATAALALALVALAHGLLGPMIARLLDRWGIRTTMIAGALATAAGFALLAVGSGAAMLLAIYGLLIGPGTALMGTVPALTLVTNWFDEGRGRAMGVVMMPVCVTIVPVVVVAALPLLGLDGVLLGSAIAILLSIPLLATVRDKPERAGGVSGQAIPSARHADATVAASRLTGRELWRSPAFLAMALGTGIVAGAGVAKSVHLVPVLVEQGWDFGRAAFLLSISGATGIVGSLLFGALADRFGGAATLAAGAVVQALVWWILVIPAPFALLVVDAVLIGLCGGGLMSAKAVLATRLFGPANFATVAGLSALTTVPFVFGIAPATGLLRELTGNYQVAFIGVIGLFAVATILFGLLVASETRSRATARAAA